jgi:hypothetical protein
MGVERKNGITMSNALEKFIESEIPEDVIWKDKMIELVTKAFNLAEMLQLHDKQVQDCEFRVYGISKSLLDKDLVHEDRYPKTDEEWVDLAENFGYISTLNTFIDNVNNGVVAKDYPHLQFRVVPVGYYRKTADCPREVDIVPTNKLHYIIRGE